MDQKIIMPSSSSSSGGGGGRVSRDPRIVLVELCNEQQFTTAGTSSYVARPIGPIISGLGPWIQDIVAHVNGRVFSANFKYKITAERSYDGETWTAFSGEILAEQTATGYKLSSAYSTRTDLGLMVRFKLELSDSGAKEVGTLSITVAIRLWQ